MIFHHRNNQKMPDLFIIIQTFYFSHTDIESNCIQEQNTKQCKAASKMHQCDLQYLVAQNYIKKVTTILQLFSS